MPQPSELKLGDLVKEVHALSGLPVGDAARMIGLGRRQFYNLAKGFGTKAATESHIRLVAMQLAEISERVRAAILTPLGPDSTSYFETAESRDAAALRSKVSALLHRIDTRGIRQVRRAIPRKASADAQAARRKLVLEDLAGQNDKSDDG